MAKRGRPKKSVTATTAGNGETTSGYFRRIFKENPSLLVSKSNSELLSRWLADHPGHKEVPKNVQGNMSNVKSLLRKKKRKKLGRPKKVEQAAQVEIVGARPMPIRVAPKGLEALEEQIDDCLTFAKKLDRDGLDEVIRLLRKGRNAVVWKLGQ
jgi:AT hook motif